MSSYIDKGSGWRYRKQTTTIPEQQKCTIMMRALDAAWQYGLLHDCCQSHKEVPQCSSRLSQFHEDLNMIAIIETSDQPCWLAEACILLSFFFPQCSSRL